MKDGVEVIFSKVNTTLKLSHVSSVSKPFVIFVMAKRKLDNVEGSKIKYAKVDPTDHTSGSKGIQLNIKNDHNHNGQLVEEESQSSLVKEEEEGQEEGISSEEDIVDEDKPHADTSRKQKSQLTAQDIQLARETAELFKSNIFKLQIDELMKEVKVKKSHEEVMDKVLHRLHDLIKRSHLLKIYLYKRRKGYSTTRRWLFLSLIQNPQTSSTLFPMGNQRIYR